MILEIKTAGTKLTGINQPSNSSCATYESAWFS